MCRSSFADRRGCRADHRYRGIALAAVGNQLRADFRRFQAAHINRRGLAALRQPRPAERRVFRAEVASNKGCALGIITMRQRNSGIGRCARRRRHARDDLKRNARFGRGLQLFAAAAKINGSPPFRRITVLPSFAASTSRRLISCCGTDMPEALLPTQIVSASRRTSSRTSGVTVVVKHHVRLLKGLQAAQSQQSGIARPCSDKNNFAGALFRLPKFIFQRFFRFGFVARQHQAGKTTGKHALPKAAAFGGGFQMGFNMVTPVARRFSQPPQVGGQQGFDFSRKIRDSTGALPLEEMATSSGERSTIDGKTNEHSA